ncbi:MAG: methylated-DNA--[protein]-cysteine S-methyltransferase [Bacteroidales bacterium]|nr:methylated-DNA--[protein]-cysteine S-methyltransferase [Bacteroidales bacterium]
MKELNKIYIRNFETPFGELLIGSYQDKLCLCDWKYRKMRQKIDKRIKEGLNATFVEHDSAVIQKTQDQLCEYFDGKRHVFEIPLLLTGSPFQQSVWNELLKILYGKRESYMGLSKKIKNTNAVRAVAAANGGNAISIIIPCNRIVGSNGKLAGYAGGLSAKKRLLQQETEHICSKQFSLFDKN